MPGIHKNHGILQHCQHPHQTNNINSTITTKCPYLFRRKPTLVDDNIGRNGLFSLTVFTLVLCCGSTLALTTPVLALLGFRLVVGGPGTQAGVGVEIHGVVRLLQIWRGVNFSVMKSFEIGNKIIRE